MSRMPLGAELDRTHATMDPHAQLRIYEALDALALVLDSEATEVIMAITGTVIVHHGAVNVPAHDPDLQTAARKVVLRWLNDRGF